MQLKKSHRSKPVIDKKTECGSSSFICYAAVGMQGWRKTMEDAHIANINLGNRKYIFGVFDGHGSGSVAEFVSKHFIREFTNNGFYKQGNYKKALQDTFI